MLDSGASCNFVSQQLLQDLGVDWDLVIAQKVRLADGTMLSTCGCAQLKITFGDFVYFGAFMVLQAKVPLILGMPFFRDLQPEVDWKARKVSVRVKGAKVKLPAVQYGKKSVRVVVKSWPSATSCENAFSCLPVDPVGDDDAVDDDVACQQPFHESSDIVVAPADVAQVCAIDGVSGSSGNCKSRNASGQVGNTSGGSESDVQQLARPCIISHAPRTSKGDKCMHAARVKCKICGKKGVQEQCARCTNGSFEHLEGQLRDTTGSIVSDDADVDCTACVSSTEIVPLKQFVRGGKRGHYLKFGVVMLDNERQLGSICVDDVTPVLSADQIVLSKQFGGVGKLVDAFNSAQLCGLKSVVQNCDHCGHCHFDEGDQIVQHKLHKCLACKKLFNSVDASGMSVGNPLADVFNFLVKEQQLFFTHRHAHGGDGDSEAVHGELTQLADAELARLKKKFPEVFATPVYPVERSGVKFEHKIPLIDENAPAPKRKLYPLDQLELEELKKQIQELLDTNRIEPSNGPYGAPILFAKKKDGRLRMCIDYRMLNQQTRNDVFPLPRIDELLQRLDGARVFSKLDLRDGYHQVPMYEPDRYKTAFTCRYGTFQYTVMPFGLMTAPSTF